jgi:cytoskeletal protein CcmA (bactofilin family)
MSNDNHAAGTVIMCVLINSVIKIKCMKKSFLLYLVGIIFLTPSFLVHGAVFSANKDSYLLNKEAVLSENLYVVSNNISLTGKSTGDVFAAGDSVWVDGDMKGDLFLAGSLVNITSPVLGDVRVAGAFITVASSTKGDLIVFGSTVNITDKSTVGGDTVISGGSVDLRGVFEGDVIVNSNKAFINAKINGNIKANVGSLTIGKDAVILGKLSYNSPKEAVIESGAQVEDISFKEIEGVRGFKQKAWVFVSVIFLLKLLMVFIAGVVLLSIFRRFTEVSSVEVIDYPGRSLFTGFVFFVITPLAAFLLIGSVLGGILGVTSLVIYIALLCIAKILSVIILGVWVYSIAKKDCNVLECLSWKSVAVGSLVSGALMFIPIVGWVINAVIFLTALGVMAQVFYRKIWLNR